MLLVNENEKENSCNYAHFYCMLVLVSLQFGYCALMSPQHQNQRVTLCCKEESINYMNDTPVF